MRNLVLAVLFLAAISLPLADSLLHLDRTAALTENRQLAAMPGLASEIRAVLQHPATIASWSGLFQAVVDYPANFTRFYNDNFGFRRLLVRAHSRLALLGLPTKGNVIIGQQGWLFLGEARARESYQAAVLFSPQDLANWQTELERRRDWLAAQGADYLLVIAPEKSTIYPQFMPRAVPRLGPQTRLDQLLRYLEENSDLQVVDLRPALVQASAQRQTYTRTDTHWNDWGAFVASQQIIARLAASHPTLHLQNAADYAFKEKTTSGGDLASMLAIGDLFTNQAIVAEALVPLRAQQAETGLGPLLDVPEWNQPAAWETPGEDAPSLLMFRDSFGRSLIPFLSEHFRRSVYIHRYSLDEAVLLRERPTIVIQEMAERELQGTTPPESSE